MSPLILHHYPPSPVAEKVRKALGLKRLAWRSVEQPRIPPRPLLFPMNGGYRRVPVLQIGADLYCDSLMILTELESRYPEPSLFPQGQAAVHLGLCRWFDSQLFPLAVRMAMVPALDNVPVELARDRARLYLGPDGDFAAERERMPHVLAQMRIALGWVDQLLAERSGGALLAGPPGLADVGLYYLVWFIRTRYVEQADYLAGFPALLQWFSELDARGHGDSEPLSPEEALAIGAEATPADLPDALVEDTDPDPTLQLGVSVSVVTDADSGETPVTGRLAGLSRERISLDLDSPEAGHTRVHLPRLGYVVRRV